MVEAALVSPLLLLLIMGIVEMAFYMRDDVALTSAVRNGGRIASANAGAGPGGVAADDGSCTSPCTPSNAPMFAQLAANAIQTAGTALPRNAVQELWVYKANSDGKPVADPTFTTCTTLCVRYKWQESAAAFRYISGTWLSSTVNACANNNPDSVGVYMKIKHSWITGFFGSSKTLTDYAVFAFEPLPTLTCAAGSHS